MKCFENDWISSKLPKILAKGGDLDQTKEIVKTIYPFIRIAYKYLSCQGL
jgi:hypothetical protein